jgi:VWFA-related protein
LPEGGVDDKTPIITNTDLITFNVTVTDIYGRFVSGLSKTAFSVVDEKAPQEITFFSDEDAPVSVGILFDVSGSMSGDKVRRARDALAHFIQTSHDRDEYFDRIQLTRAIVDGSHARRPGGAGQTDLCSDQEQHCAL